MAMSGIVILFLDVTVFRS